ncbi:MAG TPA: cytochrome c, partial [Cyclobacteriaceae bacterium]
MILKYLPLFTFRRAAGMHYFLGLLCVGLVFMTSCSSGSRSDENDIVADSASIARGRELFGRDCISCHSFAQDGIGPHLAGVTKEVSADWLRSFIRNPDQVIHSGDKRAQVLFTSYKTIMPAFSQYTDEDLTDIIAFLNTRREQTAPTRSASPDALADPIPEKIPMSDLVVGLQ